jgi:hypothetical protein
MQNKKTLKILNDIISKGGLMASCAKLYLNDEVMAHQFIIECSEQCDQVLAKEYWGNELVFDIINYSKHSKTKITSNNHLINYLNVKN